jgi:hypothetical protein
LFSFREIEAKQPASADIDDSLDDPSIADDPRKPDAPPLCDDCGASMRVSSTRKTMRWYRCPACGKTKKVKR